MEPKITYCEPRYAEGYCEGFFEEIKPVGATRARPGKYARMAQLRALRLPKYEARDHGRAPQ